MFAAAKLADEPNWVKPEWRWQRETESGGPALRNPREGVGFRVRITARPWHVRGPGWLLRRCALRPPAAAKQPQYLFAGS
jgi:hypothetical protein